MERDTISARIEEAEILLKHYVDILSFDSISIFKENGTLLYSSDPTLQQQDEIESLFEALDGFYYAFEIEEIRSIILYDYSSCLIIIPLYLGNWGEVEGWLFALGSCEKIGCVGIVNQLIIQLENLKKRDISEELTIERHEKKLRKAFDFPNILGREFDKLENSVVMLDGIKGFVMQTYGEAPWGIATKKSGRKYPEPISQLIHDLVLEIEQLGIGVPPYGSTPVDEPQPIDRENQDIIDSEEKLQYAKSDRILLITLTYLLILNIVLYVVDSEAYSPYFLGQILVHFVLYVFFSMSRSSNPPRNDYLCPCVLLLFGILMLIGGAVMVVTQFNFDSLSVFLFSIYVILYGVLFTVVIWER